MNRRITAGSTVESRCTRCRELLNHTVVAMVGDKIVRVECNTCHGVHGYHPVKAPKEPAAPRAGQTKAAAPRKPKVDPEAAARAEWAALQPGMDPARAVPYDMSGRYRVNDLLRHQHFGLGIVRLVLPNKIEVLFQEGKKLLRCG